MLESLVYKGQVFLCKGYNNFLIFTRESTKNTTKMVIIRGNSSKSRVKLDVDFDELVLTNTLTGARKVFEDFDTRGSGLYHAALLDFTGLQVGEYKYQAKLLNRVVQNGLLIVEPFDESEEPVQIVTPEMEKTVITYQN